MGQLRGDFLRSFCFNTFDARCSRRSLCRAPALSRCLCRASALYRSCRRPAPSVSGAQTVRRAGPDAESAGAGQRERADTESAGARHRERRQSAGARHRERRGATQRAESAGPTQRRPGALCIEALAVSVSAPALSLRSLCRVPALSRSLCLLSVSSSGLCRAPALSVSGPVRRGPRALALCWVPAAPALSRRSLLPRYRASGPGSRGPALALCVDDVGPRSGALCVCVGPIRFCGPTAQIPQTLTVPPDMVQPPAPIRVAGHPLPRPPMSTDHPNPSSNPHATHPVARARSSDPRTLLFGGNKGPIQNSSPSKRNLKNPYITPV